MFAVHLLRHWGCYTNNFDKRFWTIWKFVKTNPKWVDGSDHFCCISYNSSISDEWNDSHLWSTCCFSLSVSQKLLLQHNIQSNEEEDPILHKVRMQRGEIDSLMANARLALDDLLGQLYDLECVIEQTGNDVLQHRCRITLPFVQTLDSRLESVTKAVSSACRTLFEKQLYSTIL